MTRFLSLSSGSNGNCYYIGNDDIALLIDLGIGGRTVKKRLSVKELDIEQVAMVLVTHEHLDHIKYLAGFTKKFKRPVFTTSKLRTVLEHHPVTRGQLCGCVCETVPGVETEAAGVRFIPFSVPHDAHDTVGYFIDFFGDKFTFLTDLGEVTEDAIKYCRQSSHIIVESNYDPYLLAHGSYTPELKKRIMEGHGHLSNEQTAELLKLAFHDNLKSVYLCHLSENNTRPQIAEESARAALDSVGGTEVSVYALPRRESSQIFMI